MNTEFSPDQAPAFPISAKRVEQVLAFESLGNDKTRHAFAAAYVTGETRTTYLAKMAGIDPGTSSKWFKLLSDDVSLADPLSAERKRQLLATWAEDDKAPKNVRLSAIDLDSKLAGDYAPQQVQQVTIHMVMGDGGRPALEGQLAERLARLGLELPGLPGTGKAPALLPGPVKGSK